MKKVLVDNNDIRWMQSEYKFLRDLKYSDNLIFQIETRRIESIDLPFFPINMTDGTVCELTNKPRKTKILYVCQPEGRGEIYELKETSTCEYEVIVLTSVLCSHPDFK